MGEVAVPALGGIEGSVLLQALPLLPFLANEDEEDACECTQTLSAVVWHPGTSLDVYAWLASACSRSRGWPASWPCTWRVWWPTGPLQAAGYAVELAGSFAMRLFGSMMALSGLVDTLVVVSAYLRSRKLTGCRGIATLARGIECGC